MELPVLHRRNLLRSLLAAPVVIAANRLMPVKSLVLPKPNLVSVIPDNMITSLSALGSGTINAIEVVMATGERYALLRDVPLMPGSVVQFPLPFVMSKGDRLDVKTTGDAEVHINRYMFSSNQMVSEHITRHA